MAMSAAVLGAAIGNAICDTNASPEVKAQVIAIWTDIATEIISHITTMGMVTVALGIPVATAGSPAAQTGATTGPGTGTIS